ncbi:MAG: HNH endonuclease [Bacteroidota bacterium]
MTGHKAYNAIRWTDEMIGFLKGNFFEMTNQQLAAHLELKLTVVRTMCYELGLKRIEMEYWTKEQVKFLRESYQVMGDVELAEIFTTCYPKNKGWSKKHIEKKRRYLKLKRTEAEKQAIQQRNTDAGRFAINHWRRWIDREAPVGETRVWKNETGRLFQVIKTESGFVHHARWLWQQTHGEIAQGMKVRLIDGEATNVSIENLELVTAGELSAINSRISSQGLSDNYIAGILTHGRKDLRDAVKNAPELIELKRNQLLLNRQINNHGKSQN